MIAPPKKNRLWGLKLLLAAPLLWVLSFAFLPPPADWFFGTREYIRHIQSHDTSEAERLRHLILSSQRLTNGHDAGIIVGYDHASWQILKAGITPTDFPVLLTLYKEANPNTALHMGISWAIAAQCQTGLDFLTATLKDKASAHLDELDALDILSYMTVLAQSEDATCPASLRDPIEFVQKSLYEKSVP